MKITRADGSTVEGSPQELAQFEEFSRHVGLRQPATPISAEEITDDWEFVSADVAFRMLTRIKLSEQTQAVIAAIYNGGDKWTSAKKLQQVINYTPSQFAGLMGAFGRRLVNTPGWVAGSAFFDYKWDADQSCYLYRIPPTVRLAIEKARLT
jgi:hypothetical protein